MLYQRKALQKMLIIEGNLLLWRGVFRIKFGDFKNYKTKKNVCLRNMINSLIYSSALIST